MLDERHDGKAMKNHQCVFDEHGFCFECDAPGPKVQTGFQTWWEQEGTSKFESSHGERPYIDAEECHDLCWIAWKNGAFRRSDGPSELVDQDTAQQVAFDLIAQYIQKTGCQSEEDIAKAAAKLLAMVVDLMEGAAATSLGIDKVRLIDAGGNTLN